MSIRFGFFCLFFVSFSSSSRIFHSYGDVTIAGEGLQILTCVRQSWPVSNEGSHLLRHGAFVYIGHLRGPVTLTPISERLAVDLSLPVLHLRSVAAGIRTPNFPLARRLL